MTKSKTDPQSKRPAFGKDFDRGCVGFVHSSGQLLSAGIAYLTRREKKGGITISHAFLVTGPSRCIEANLPVGVVTSDLTKEYLDRDDRRVFFRKPRDLTPAVARRIVKTAKAQLGAKFDYGGFAALGLGGSFLGHLVDVVFGGKPKALLAGLTHQEGRWVCSELVAYCLRQEPRYRGKGVLARAPEIVTPQELFEDDELFEPWPTSARSQSATESKRY